MLSQQSFPLPLSTCTHTNAHAHTQSHTHSHTYPYTHSHTHTHTHTHREKARNSFKKQPNNSKLHTHTHTHTLQIIISRTWPPKSCEERNDNSKVSNQRSRRHTVGRHKAVNTLSLMPLQKISIPSENHAPQCSGEQHKTGALPKKRFSSADNTLKTKRNFSQISGCLYFDDEIPTAPLLYRRRKRLHLQALLKRGLAGNTQTHEPCQYGSELQNETFELPILCTSSPTHQTNEKRVLKKSKLSW